MVPPSKPRIPAAERNLQDGVPLLGERPCLGIGVAVGVVNALRVHLLLPPLLVRRVLVLACVVPRLERVRLRLQRRVPRRKLPIQEGLRRCELPLLLVPRCPVRRARRRLLRRLPVREQMLDLGDRQWWRVAAGRRVLRVRRRWWRLRVMVVQHVVRDLVSSAVVSSAVVSNAMVSNAVVSNAVVSNAVVSNAMVSNAVMMVGRRLTRRVRMGRDMLVVVIGGEAGVVVTRSVAAQHGAADRGVERL